MPFPLLESLAHAAALAAASLIAWMVFLVLGPVACLVVLLLDLAGVDLPGGASWIHLGTLASWTMLLVAALATRTASRLARDVARRHRPERATRRQRRGRTVTIGGLGGPPVDPLLAWIWVEARARERRAAAAGSPASASQARRPSPPPPAGKSSPPRPSVAPVDPHAVLGVKRGASADEIRRAYRALVKRHHPDRAASPSAEMRAAATRKTREIREAYEALKRGPASPS